jgi:putative phosphoesterase
MSLVGVISDTHGHLRVSALQALQACDHILHAGDVGGPEILAELRRLAPLTAVRGNCDNGHWAERLPLETVVGIEGLSFYLTHAMERPDRIPQGVQVVVYGHTHHPDQQRRDGVLFLNPGSAGPKRGSLPICLARLTVEGTAIRGIEFVNL